MQPSTCSPCNQCQRGVSLLIVLVVLLLTMTAIAGALRVANLNEALVGSTSDYQRTFAAAEALLQDAETDVRGRLPPYSQIQADGLVGKPCKPDATGLVNRPNVVGCRDVDDPPGSGSKPWFPTTQNPEEYESIATIVAVNPNELCKDGICVPGSGNFYTNGTPIENNLTKMLPLGAYFGQFTAAKASSASTILDLTSNPVLTSNTAQPVDQTRPFARYWVEVLRYGNAGAPNNNPAYNYDPGDGWYVYRITVVAQGLKSGSKVVLRSQFVPNPKAQNG